MTPTQKQKIRASIVSWCKAAISNEIRIHYSQQRPFGYHDRPEQGTFSLDCSGLIGNVFWNAMHDLHVFLHDPLDERYTGTGNTWTLEAWLRRDGKRVTETNGYLVGDVARWGQGHHSHTGVCMKAGTAKTSDWCSHGRESGPQVVKLGYRDDLVGVWRHPSLL